jgi:hypothetical protein
MSPNVSRVAIWGTFPAGVFMIPVTQGINLFLDRSNISGQPFASVLEERSSQQHPEEQALLMSANLKSHLLTIFYQLI